FSLRVRDRLKQAREAIACDLSGDGDMPYSHVYDIADPALFRPTLRAAEAELLVTGSGRFQAQLIRINLYNLCMQRGSDTLPPVVHAANDSTRAPIFFLADPDQPAMQHRGVAFSPGDIAFYSPGAVSHHRTEGPSRFATMSLTPDDLASASEAIIGRVLELPVQTRFVRPAAPLMARLMTLHQKATSLAKQAPHA